MDLGEILKKLDWKKLLLTVWEGVLPDLKKRVNDTSSKIDDSILAALELLVDRFLREEEKKSVE